MDFKKLHDSNPDKYFLKICEELSELQTAILHYCDGKIEYDSVVEEIADVSIQIEKLMRWLGDFNSKTYNMVFDQVNELEQEKYKKLEEIIEEMK